MADKKSAAAAEAAHEDVVYVPAAETPVAPVESNDSSKLNTLSVVALATAASGFGAVAGVITGHFALSQIRRTGEKGRGLALAGLITGYAGVAAAILIGALSVGSAISHNRFDNDNRGGFSVQYRDQGLQGSQPHGDQNFGGMMGGQLGQGQGQLGQGQGQLGQGQGQLGQGQGIQGGTITLDGNGNATLTAPDGSTITLPNGPGMMGGKGFGGGQVQIVPNPTDVPQNN